MATLWSTAQGDLMPQALSRASGRARHIYEGHVRGGQVHRMVVDASECRACGGSPSFDPLLPRVS